MKDANNGMLPAAFQELIEKVKHEQEVVISQIGNRSGQSRICADLFAYVPGNFVWITRDDKEARQAETLLKFWLEDSDVQVVRMTEQPTADLYAAIQEREKLVVVIHLELLRSAFPDRSSYAKSIERIEVGEHRSPLDLAQRVVMTGYVANTHADTKGSCARRGEIFDIFPIHSTTAYRVEFSDNAIAKISQLDKGTKPKTFERLSIPPARLAKGSVSFWSIWSEKPTLVYEDPEGDQHPLWQDIQMREGFKRIIMHPFKTQQSEIVGVQPAPLFHNNLESAITTLKKKKREGWQLHFLSTITGAKLHNFIRNKLNNKDAVRLAPAIVEGFVVQLTKELYITDKELFGRDTDAIKTSKNVLDEAFLSNVEEGDFLVHADHGVGRFTGMKVQAIDRVSREYFLLEYAEQDKLYVPVENADKLTKYLGTEQPKLHRLSGTSWKSVTSRIKDEARILAKELLQLYAERALVTAPVCGPEKPEERALRESFPYTETVDQQQAIVDVAHDMQQAKPMDRLICGDVGFGKTEVAIRAAFKAMANGYQVALLSPTTILTQQHYDTFKERLKGLSVRIANLSRFQTSKQQDEVVRDIQTEDVDIVIGTHRLLSKDIHFKKLGLVIIDEEQRFGVKHKEQLKKLRKETHVLTLTATPIPRTLNIALSNIRDISLIETPPEGRLPIETIIEPYSDMLVAEAIKKEFVREGQVYYLYNNVETISLAAKRLQRIVPEAKIGIAHGQMDEEELSHVMSNFDTNKTNLLVCSTIIENGLDLPNVNTIIVESATKFGLAQLYQLRGRVGRGLRQAYAFFLYGSHKLTGTAKRRLQSLLEARELGSGFQLALRDLEIRGVGNILGREQHGKVSAVGLALYSRLLSQAVDEIKTGKKSTEHRDILIDLPLSIGIPTAYIPREHNRLRLYQQVASVTKLAALNSAYGDMMEAYGKPAPQEVKNLFALLKLRINCQRTDITRIETKKLGHDIKLIITFAPSINPKMIPHLFEINDAWTFSQDSVKIRFEALGTDWHKVLERIVEIASKFRIEAKLTATDPAPMAEPEAPIAEEELKEESAEPEQEDGESD